MTSVVFTCKQGNIVGLQCSGHTGFAKRGKDIVCAAISSVVQTALLGVLNVAKIAAQFTIEDRTGYLSLELPDGLDETKQQMAQAILQTAKLGVEDIANNYPQFVKMEVK